MVGGIQGQVNEKPWIWRCLQEIVGGTSRLRSLTDSLGALAAYKDFLALWNDANADLPVLKQAKSEYPRLQ
jgi:hypothetical protein